MFQEDIVTTSEKAQRKYRDSGITLKKKNVRGGIFNKNISHPERGKNPLSSVSVGIGTNGDQYRSVLKKKRLNSK